jgi:hypothetical protein
MHEMPLPKEVTYLTFVASRMHFTPTRSSRLKFFIPRAGIALFSFSQAAADQARLKKPLNA